MIAAHLIDARTGLLERREQLERVAGRFGRRSAIDASAADLQSLLSEVDAALERIDHGTFGICDVCHDGIETERIAQDPLARSCAEHPSPAELTRVERDLRLARDVQLGLLPGIEAPIAGWQYRYKYESATAVGGDFCDVIRVPSRDETIVLVGDVSGKGVAASMLMSSLLATFRTLASMGLPTCELLTRANAIFHVSAPGPSFATVAAAALLPDGAVDLYSAGHWPPLLRHQGLTVPLTVDAGLPLGLFPESRYAPTPIRLSAGDTLLFYTDGVVEAENTNGDDYTLDRLGQTLAAAEREPLDTLVERCLLDVRAFQDRNRADDDLLLFAVRAAS
jgi:sigma-B regulation protein RsbU (phosphoserine phosphatase)